MTNSERLARRRQLTDKQKAFLDYATQEEAPTMEQIRVHFGFAGCSSVSAYIRALIRKGCLPHGWTCARAKRTKAFPAKAPADSSPVAPRTPGPFDTSHTERLKLSRWMKMDRDALAAMCWGHFSALPRGHASRKHFAWILRFQRAKQR
jgi:hypothetical protein